MTSRSKNAVRSYETEIEKCREESNWKKAVDLAKQLKNRSPQHESLAHFLIGEGKLEAYLEEWPPISENIERAQRELSEARGYLTLATDEAGKKAGVALDAHLLLGKLNYACGAYEDALKNYKLAELNTLTEKELPLRSLRIVAESYAIKGLCLEQTEAPVPSSKFKLAEREAEMIRSYEVSSELTLLFAQRGGSGGGGLLHPALQRAPLLLLRAGQPARAVHRYRCMVRAVECGWTAPLRLTLAWQLAHLLLRTQHPYTPPEPSGPAGGGGPGGSLPRRRDDSEGPWKPKMYSGINQFVPQCAAEEALLLLLVSEALAVRDAVLSQSAEFQEARSSALGNALAVVDLLTPLAARWGQLALCRESLERAMKFSFGCAHVWRQRALAAAHHQRAQPRPPHHQHYQQESAAVSARGVMQHARRLCAEDAPLHLVGAATCYRTGEIEEGISLAENALAIEERASGAMLARSHLYVGIGYQLKSQKSKCRLSKEAASARSLKALLRAVQLDPNDHLAFYHLALHHAYHHQLDEAMEAVRGALRCAGTSCAALRLAAALGAARGPAGGAAGGALSAARLARDQYPRSPAALATLAHLYAALHQEQAALATGKELLTLLYSSEELEDLDELEQGDQLDALSDEELHSARDAGSAVCESVCGRTDRALSERCDSPAQRRAAGWLLLAELSLRVGRTSAAAGCVAEAAALTPCSHLVFYTRGLVHEAEEEWTEALDCFRNAVALQPTHLDSLVHLGSAYYCTGCAGLAEGALRAAARLAPRRADTWRRLAGVLAARGHHGAAADAAAAALLLPAQPHYTQNC